MNKICRICLEEGVLSSIFTKNFNLSLCDMIEYCCNIKVSKNDGLPEQMCSNCVYKLGIAYHFKQTYESADIRLRQYLGLMVPEKTREMAVMTDPIVPVEQTLIKKCRCKQSAHRKTSSNYKPKPESEKQKRGPKPKPKQPHNCYECNKQFRCQAQLDMHVRTHTGDKPFGCMYCPRRFTQKHNLTIHLRTHTGDKPFQCEVCSKRFSAQGNLQAHLKIHTGQRDHECTLCPKSFITSSDLTRHMHKHKRVKNFKCDLCGAAYIHQRDFKLHKMKKHQIKQQCLKTHNDGYKNSANIDIGIDVGKDAPQISIDNNITNKETSHHSHHNIQHLLNVKSGQNDPVPPELNQSILNYGQKSKDMFVGSNHNCSTCGQQFEYLNALAQHYLQHHSVCQ